MSMHIDEFRERLESEFGDEPPHRPVAQELEQGQRRLRNRRLATFGGGLVTATVLTVAVLGASQLVGSDAGTHAAGRINLESAPDVLTSCTRSTNASGVGREAMFGPTAGRPELVTMSSSTMGASAVIRSGDGATWAGCFVRSDAGAEFHSGLTIYDVSNARGSASWGWGGGCPIVGDEPDPGCDSFHVSWTDRRPAVVAEVKVVTADNVTTQASVKDGYIAFDYVGRLPAGVEPDAHGTLMNLRAIKVITFYDARGVVLARQNFNKTEYSPSGEEREPLRRYPSLTGDEIH